MKQKEETSSVVLIAEMTANHAWRCRNEVIQMSDLQLSILNAKSSIWFTTWNVWKSYQTGKLVQLLWYYHEILGISETGWMASGMLINDNKTLIYTSHDHDYVRGMGIILSRWAASSLLCWRPVRQGKYVKLTFVQVYVPMEYDSDMDKDTF